MAAGGRVSIPAGARRTVTDIKEIAGGHSDEEVYAMLRECNMDPNETAQRLLLQDTFHEVKRKRDKKKEGSKEPSDTRWRPAVQGRGGKSGRGNYISRNLANSNDPAERSAIAGKENGINQITEKSSGSTPTINTNMDTKTSSSAPSLPSGLSNGPSQLVDPAAVVVTNSSAVGDAIKSDSTALVDMKGGLPSEGVVTVVGPNAPQSLKSASASDPVLVCSINFHNYGDVGAPRQAVGSKMSVEHKVGHDLPADNKGSSQQSGSSSFGRSGSRPSSSYSSRSQQSFGSQKVMPNKEWKPKPTRTTASQATENAIIPNDVPLAADTVPQSAPISNSVSKENLLKVEKSLNDLQLSDKQHVIIPDHLQVSESEKYGLSFGSFNAGFQQTLSSSDPECAKSSFLPEYDSFQELSGIDDEPQSMPRDQSSSSTAQEEAVHVPQQLPSTKLENYSPSAVENSSISSTELDQRRDDSATSRLPQSTVVHTAPSYSAFGLAPQSHGDQITMIEKSESLVQKPTNFATSYCIQLYQPTADADELLSPSLVAEAASKYGSIPVLPAQTGQDQEGNNSPMLASSVSASVAAPSAGVIPTSIAIPQQSVPVFRQSLGVHLPHFPTNYVPYNQYISPFFIPPPTLHPFLGNATFLQPPSTGAMYPAPGSAGVLPVKYSVPSFKPGANVGSQASVGVPGAYGTYGSSPSVYTNNTTVSSGNPVENVDVASSQLKENIYIAGHQTEGSTLWVPAPGRDISGLQANSYYGRPPRGQQVTFAPQAGHGPFGGIYHPAHTVTGAAVHPLLQPPHTMAGAVEIVGAPGSVYQQPQGQMNWANY
ncbi:GBF-interacting protein 1-like [Phragmites australis]|uniref:GBF-interacting protein 1-like n=1 Tax=Phragmites australis TaxID=29695 RepID=UPI002D779B55|nr:GBF-interacting protein 1-like [Phragmites australis]